MSSGIYQIRNLINDKIYIGSSVNLEKRKRSHFANLKRNVHENSKLQNAYNKYGKDNFEFETLITCVPDLLLWYEQQFIDQWKPEYNICNVAGNTLGIKLSDETKEKLSDIRSGENHPNFGKHLSEETKKKISLSNLGKTRNSGRKMSDESKIKMSLARKGRIMSDEERQKRIGKKLSEDTKRKISESHKNISDETREKLRSSRLGKKHTDETRKKMSESRRKYFDNLKEKEKEL